MELRSALLYLGEKMNVNERYVILLLTTATVETLAMGSLFCRLEEVKIVGMTVLMGAIYGIANSMIACRDCIEYYTVGHFWDKRRVTNRLIRNLDPNLNALVWGCVTTWAAAALAGFCLSLVCRFPSGGQMDNAITAGQLFPYLAAALGIVLKISQVRARIAQKAMEADPYKKYRGVPLGMQDRWEACQIRNSTGDMILKLGTAILCSLIFIYRDRGISISREHFND